MIVLNFITGLLFIAGLFTFWFCFGYLFLYIKSKYYRSINVSYWRFLKDEYKEGDFFTKGVIHGFAIFILLLVSFPCLILITNIGSFMISLFIQA